MKLYHRIDYVNRFPSREIEEIKIRIAMSAQWLNRRLASSRPWHNLNSWSSWQIINRRYLISANFQCLESLKIKSWWMLKSRKGSFWEYKWLSKSGEPAIPAITIDWILRADSMCAAPPLARTACCDSSFRCQTKPHDKSISFLCTALNPNIDVVSTL